MDTTKTITATALAELCGVTARTITDLAKRGIVVQAARGYVLADTVTNERNRREVPPRD